MVRRRATQLLRRGDFPNTAKHALFRRVFHTTQSCPIPRNITHDYEKRVKELEQYKPLRHCYPRLSDLDASRAPHGSEQSIAAFVNEWDHLERNETQSGNRRLSGRVVSVRTSGSKLVFVTLNSNLTSGHNVQIVCNLNLLSDTPHAEFRSWSKVIRKGDWWHVTGHPHRTRAGELSILATQLPRLLAPSLHQIPEALKRSDARASRRHVDMLVNPETMQTLILRHHLERALIAWFDSEDFVKVSTPLLSGCAGGATARPFETVATELDGHTLNLRIAPELWLKRLAVGGLGRVYEIGPAFRNEGVDATHNPEFTICEFYAKLVSVEWLMQHTEDLLRHLCAELHYARASRFPDLDLPGLDFFQGPFTRMEFIPTLERLMEETIPDLSQADAKEQIMSLFRRKCLELPKNSSLPNLLDALGSHYIEPLCDFPTFIVNHPACLSPLSKHFTCCSTGQIVGARAELFIRGREYANMYEEENSPFEQRHKFAQQIEYRKIGVDGDRTSNVDENYLEALEWGLPPTGGWGCGIDRLVMLFAGREKIADVLTFGNLRHVVGSSSTFQ